MQGKLLDINQRDQELIKQIELRIKNKRKVIRYSEKNDLDPNEYKKRINLDKHYSEITLGSF